MGIIFGLVVLVGVVVYIVLDVYWQGNCSRTAERGILPGDRGRLIMVLLREFVHQIRKG
jgi:hypothetical protein